MCLVLPIDYCPLPSGLIAIYERQDPEHSAVTEWQLAGVILLPIELGANLSRFDPLQNCLSLTQYNFGQPVIHKNTIMAPFLNENDPSESGVVFASKRNGRWEVETILPLPISESSHHPDYASNWVPTGLHQDLAAVGALDASDGMSINCIHFYLTFSFA